MPVEMITVQDVRAAGFCPSGIRRWFERYNLDFKAFTREGSTGIEADVLLATGDALAERVVTRTRERRALG